MWKNRHFKPSIGSHAVVYVARGKLNFTRVFNGTATCVLMTWHRVLCIYLYVSFCAPHIILCFLFLFFLCFCLPPSTSAFLCLCFLCFCLYFLCLFLPVFLLSSKPRGTILLLSRHSYTSSSTTGVWIKNKKVFPQHNFQGSGFVVHVPRIVKLSNAYSAETVVKRDKGLMRMENPTKSRFQPKFSMIVCFREKTRYGLIMNEKKSGIAFCCKKTTALP